jgi:hypothetical protein
MNYDVEMDSGTMIYIYIYIKIGSGIQVGGDTDGMMIS